MSNLLRITVLTGICKCQSVQSYCLIPSVVFPVIKAIVGNPEKPCGKPGTTLKPVERKVGLE